MEVRIHESKIYAACTATKKSYNIKFLSAKGEDISPLARMAAKSFWFDKDNPQYKPDSIQEGKVQEDGTIIIEPPK